MERLWITNGSISIPPVVNPLTAACDEGYLPTDIHVLDNPGTKAVTSAAMPLLKTAVTAHGGAEPTVTVERIEDELDFEGIVAYLRSSIEAGAAADADIAVDVTPGRKYWSIISFQAGYEYGADHLYYTHLPKAYFGEVYPTIPRPAFDLIDFMAVL